MPLPSTDQHAVQGPAVYLAGPDVFRQNGREHGAHLVTDCALAGLNGLYPLDTQLDPQAYATTQAFAAAIAHTNMDLIARSQAVIANLSPFRGPNVDDGTAFEIGYAHARGLPIFGYVCTNAPTVPYRDRVKDCGGTLTRITVDHRPTWVDEHGLVVEEFGLPVNLMIATVLYGSGTIFSSAHAAITAAAEHLLAPKKA